MAQVTLNAEKNGVEIRFDSKPEQEVIDGLKETGFRWSGKQKMWYAKQSEATIYFANSIAGTSSDSVTGKTQERRENTVDLWQLTRIDGIEHNFANTREYDTVKIAKTIREHLKERFGKLVKFSVTSSRASMCSSIDVRLVSAPWDAESEMTKAIVHYAWAYANSWNYDNSDSMTDYFDVNFYGTKFERDFIDTYGDKKFTVREETEEEKSIAENFMKNFAEWKAAEADRIERERVRREEEEREAKERAKEQEAIDRANIERIGAAVKVEDVKPYFVLNLKDCGEKIFGIEEGREYYGISLYRLNAKITTEVRFPEENADLFAEFASRHLMNSFPFFAGKGGMETADLRVNSREDFDRMNKAEQETVEWYFADCVAVYVGEKLSLVIDPEGYDYARCVFEPDEKSVVDRAYNPSIGITEAENAENAKLGEAYKAMYEESAKLLEDHGGGPEKDIQSIMMERLEKLGSGLRVEGIRALTKDDLSVKSKLYAIFDSYYSVEQQIERAAFNEGDLLTVVTIGEFGGIQTRHIRFIAVRYADWAQYKDIPFILCEIEHKRGLFEMHFTKNLMIYRGWVDIPADLFYEEVPCATPGVTMKRSKMLSFDPELYGIVYRHLAAQGYTPIVDKR